jgi:hypothetical protein
LRWKSVLRVYNVLFFPFVGFALMLVPTFAFVSNQRKTWDGEATFPAVVNSLCILAVWTALASVVVFELIRRKPRGRDPTEVEAGGEAEMKPWYVMFFLGKSILLSVVLSLYAAWPGVWGSFAVAIVLAASAVALVVFRPYRNIFGNVTAILCELLALYAMILTLLNRFMYFEPITELFLIFVLEGQVAVINCLCLARIARFCYQLRKSQRSEGREPKECQVRKRTAHPIVNADEGLLIE